MISIAIINLKGGVGKSVTACNLAAELAAKSKSVLVLIWTNRATRASSSASWTTTAPAWPRLCWARTTSWRPL